MKIQRVGHLPLIGIPCWKNSATATPAVKKSHFPGAQSQSWGCLTYLIPSKGEEEARATEEYRECFRLCYPGSQEKCSIPTLHPQESELTPEDGHPSIADEVIIK